ncbi:MAG TPA: hypothetical protein PLQ93_05300 [Bacteroidia bacterium]|nr:hypothetical protein [Bacteroidia bacterium]
MIRPATLLIVLCLFLHTRISMAQKVLRLNYSRLGIHHKADFQRDDPFHYKTHDDWRYKTRRLLNFSDSVVYFDEEYGVYISEIRKVKLYVHPYHNKLFQKVFLIAGIGYISLFAVNSLLLNMQPIVTEQAALISLSFLAASYLVKQIGIKHIRLNERNYLKVLDFDWEHLNSP